MPGLRRTANCSLTSTRTPASKRASLPRASDFTKAFAKDWTRLSHSGRYDMGRLKEAMLPEATSRTDARSAALDVPPERAAVMELDG